MWTIYLRDPLLQRQGQVYEYKQFEAISRFNQVGTWSLTLNANVAAAAQLIQPDWGIELVDDAGLTVFSGPYYDIGRERDLTRNEVTLTGYDDMICLRDRLAHPQPTSSTPPYSLQEHDVRSAIGSTVLRDYVTYNAGVLAIPGRQTYGLDVDPDPLVGSAITGRARWQPLLDFLNALAQQAGGLGFRVAKIGTTLRFQVYQPIDKSATVKFSVDLGSLASYKYGKTRPDTNYVFIGGGGEGTARTIAEAQDPVQMANWGRRIETFVDRRDTTVAAELTSEGSKSLAEGKGKARLEFLPVDIPGAAYRTDYNLGDTVTAVLDESIVEVVRQITISLKPNEVRVIPTVGTPSSDMALRTFDQFVAMRRRIIQLERR